VHTRCPHCFLLLGRRYALRCVNPACSIMSDTQASGHSGRRHHVWEPPLAVSGVRGLSPAPCPRCKHSTAQEVCARCHNDIPAGWRNCVTTCLVMAGARASGKSIYIAVLKRQAELLAGQMNGALSFFDDNTRKTYEQFYQGPLYEQRRLVKATPTHDALEAHQRAPMIFNMGTAGGRPHILVLRDVAGENLEDPLVDPKAFRFFKDADAVVFLFDPMRIEGIRQQLAGLVPEQNIGGDPLAVLENVIRLIRGQSELSADRLDTPLAVVLAKFDTLVELGTIPGTDLGSALKNPGAAFSRDPSLDGAPYDHADAMLLQAEVASLLIRLNAAPLLNRVQSAFKVHQLFAVSALGASPASAEKVNERGIAPFRVLDPLKWAMAESGTLRSL
jgi:Double-GTPase 2